MTRCVFMLVASLLGAASWGADRPLQLLVVDDFEDVQNELGGYRNPFQRAPSQVQASRVAEDFHGPHGRSVRIQGHRAAEGYCGYWVHFFDFKSADKRYLDTRPFGFLSFWVKGERGGETFLIKMADRRWIEKEDALPVGSVNQFLTAGVTTAWQEVLIPLDRLPHLDRHEMGGLTLEFETPGDHCIYLDDVCFKAAANSPRPIGKDNPPVVSAGPVPRKLWVWKSADVLSDRQAGDALIDFCRQQRIDELWMQLLYSFDPPGLAGEGGDAGKAGQAGEPAVTTPPAVTIRYVAELRDFLRRSHAHGIRIHALDGAPHYSQRAHHSIPLAVVDGVIAFNRAGGEAERFDGVHFDNEPYLLLGWIDPVLREEILLEFLELNAECQRRIHAASGMKFGIDIPFWWQAADARTGRPIGDVEFRGKRQAASYHCIEMLDNVGVMNYRDTADGADGMIAHGRGLLAAADRAGRATVLMGAETFQSPPVAVCFALGLPRREFFAALRDSAAALGRTNTLLGFRLQTLDDGTNVHVGIEIPPDSLPSRKQDAQRALLQLARQTGIRRQLDPEPSAALRSVAEFTEADGEWSGFQPLPIKDRDAHETYHGFRVTRAMLSKITFADDSPRHFAAETAAAEAYFGRYPSFGGMAVHYYETFRELMRTANEETATRRPSPAATAPAHTVRRP